MFYELILNDQLWKKEDKIVTEKEVFRVFSPFQFFLIGVERNWFYMSTRDEIFLDVITSQSDNNVARKQGQHLFCCWLA